jgi:CheY-like chemotaxis protein
MHSERRGAATSGARAGAALVVDGSAVFAHFLSRLLSTRFEPVVALASGDEALEALRSDPYDLLVVDLQAKGDPLALIEAVRALPEHQPAVLAVTRTRDLELETQLSLRGAIGILEKPLVPGALFRALRGLGGTPFRSADPRARVAPDASAEILDAESGEVMLRWEIRDVSRSGAFLLSHGPLGMGERLRLRLRFGSDSLDLEAEVVRVQEPGWSVFPGIAVRFRNPDAEAQHRLDRLVAHWIEVAVRRESHDPAPRMDHRRR